MPEAAPVTIARGLAHRRDQALEQQVDRFDVAVYAVPDDLFHDHALEHEHLAEVLACVRRR